MAYDLKRVIRAIALGTVLPPRCWQLVLTTGCILSHVITIAQTGPGGVGSTDGTSTLRYWIDANAQVISTAGVLTGIADLSGNNVATTIVGNPTLAVNTVNGRNAIGFNGLNQQLLTNTFINASANPNLTIIAVYQPAITYAGSVWGEYQVGWSGRFLTDNNFDIPRTSNFVSIGFEPPVANHPSNSIPGLFVANQWTISSVVFREDVTDGTTVRVNGQIERSFTSSHEPGPFNPFIVGAGGPTYAANPFWFTGAVAEVLVFSEALNELDLLMVENYLSAKYNINLAGNNLYTGDDSNFDFDVAGIGRLDATTVRLNARGTGPVTIEALSIDNDEFLLWGHNNGGMDALEFSDIPTGVDARSNRIWYASEINTSGNAVDVGTLNLTFELSNLGPITASDLVLLVDTNGDGLFADESGISGAVALGNNLYQFQNVSLITNNSLFTFGTLNANTTPLPVELLTFHARIVNETQVEFTWATATEFNNDYFELYKSSEGFDWHSIARVTGSGTSKSLTKYQVDHNDEIETSRTYYKLTQVDIDGVATDLEIIKIDRDRGVTAVLFPNPASSFVTVLAPDFTHMEIYDGYHQRVKSSDSTTVDISNLVPGVYVVYLYTNAQLVIKKLMVTANK